MIVSGWSFEAEAVLLTALGAAAQDDAAATTSCTPARYRRCAPLPTIGTPLHLLLTSRTNGFRFSWPSNLFSSHFNM